LKIKRTYSSKASSGSFSVHTTTTTQAIFTATLLDVTFSYQFFEIPASIQTQHISHAIIMSNKTFNVTSEDVRKMESKESKYHGGNIPKDSETAAMKAHSFPLPLPHYHSLTNYPSKSSPNKNPKLIKLTASKPTCPCQSSRLVAPPLTCSPPTAAP
jgi:hypothetical protein